MTLFVGLDGLLVPLGSGSTHLSLVDIVFAAAGTELPPTTPILLGGSWWTVPDLCALARPQALHLPWAATCCYILLSLHPSYVLVH